MTPEPTPLREPLKPGSSAKSSRTTRTVKDRSGTVPPIESDTVRETSEFTKKEKQQVEDLSGLYTLIGVVTAMVNKDVAGEIVSNAEEAATAWVILGQRNPRVRAMIDSLTAASVWGAIVAIHLRMLAPAISIPAIGGQAPTQENQEVFFMPGSPEDNAALSLAMEMMRGQAPESMGGPTDTVRVAENGSNGPVGSADYKAPPMDAGEYPFPMDPNPPNA